MAALFAAVVLVPIALIEKDNPNHVHEQSNHQTGNWPYKSGDHGQDVSRVEHDSKRKQGQKIRLHIFIILSDLIINCLK